MKLISGMKTISTQFALLFSTLSLIAQDSKEFKLYVFGSEYSGQTIKFQKDQQNHQELKARLSELNCQYFDADEADTNTPAYLYLLIKGNSEYPLFIVTNLSGDVYMLKGGYDSAETFLEQFSRENLATQRLLIQYADLNPDYLKRLTQQKKVSFPLRLAYSPWGLGVETGVIFSNLANHDQWSSYKTGYYAGVIVKRNLKHKMNLHGGIMLHSLGGRSGDLRENMRLNYISIPIDLEKRLSNLKIIPGIPADLFAGIGIYGSRLVGTKAPSEIGSGGIKDWDSGIRFRLIWQQGTFRLSAGYMRGFTDILQGPEKAYNNAFQIGLTITLGD